MPIFSPGVEKTAIISVSNLQPMGLSCDIELYLASIKVAQLGGVFLPPESPVELCPRVIMPSEAGTYPVRLFVCGEEIEIVAEDVVIGVPTIAGILMLGYIWHEPLTAWEDVFSGREIPLNEEIHLGPGWVNKSEVNIIGHMDLSVTYPDGTEHTLTAVLNQDEEHAPNDGCFVQFEPFISSQEGTYTMVATLSSAGQVLDSVTYELVVIVSVPVEVYRCVYCPATFSTEAGLVSHMEANHAGKPYLVYAYLPEATVRRGDGFKANVKVFTPGGTSWNYMLRFWGTYGSHADCAGIFGVSYSDEGFYTGEIGLPTYYWDANTRRMENIPAGTYTIYSRCYYIGYPYAPADYTPVVYTVWAGVDIGLTVTVV